MDVAADNARMDGCSALLVCSTNDVVDLALFLGRLANANGARHIGVIIAQASAVVHNNKVAFLDGVGSRLCMWIGTVCSASNNRAKRERIGTVGEHVVLELGTDLHLGNPRLNKAADMLEGGVGNCLSIAHNLDLFGVLNNAQIANIAMQARCETSNASCKALRNKCVEESEVAGILNCNNMRTSIEGAQRCPGGVLCDIHIDLPGSIWA